MNEEIIKQVRCIEKKKDGTVCDELMLVRHVDTDRIGNPQQWYKCKNNHWRVIPIKE